MFVLPWRLHKSYLEENAYSLGPFVLILLSLLASTLGVFPSQRLIKLPVQAQPHTSSDRGAVHS